MSRPTTLRHRLVEVVAHQMCLRIGGIVRSDELYDLGLPGLAVARAEWDGRGNFDAFALQRIRWSMIDELRKRRRTPQTMALVATEVSAEHHGRTRDELLATSDNPQAAAEESIDDVIDSSAGSFALDIDAAQAVENDSERIRLRRAVTELPPPQDRVVDLYSYQGESFEEVSKTLGLPRATVFDLYARAVASLRRTFGAPREVRDQAAPP